MVWLCIMSSNIISSVLTNQTEHGYLGPCAFCLSCFLERAVWGPWISLAMGTWPNIINDH